MKDVSNFEKFLVQLHRTIWRVSEKALVRNVHHIVNKGTLLFQRKKATRTLSAVFCLYRNTSTISHSWLRSSELPGGFPLRHFSPADRRNDLFHSHRVISFALHPLDIKETGLGEHVFVWNLSTLLFWNNFD